MIPLLTGTDDRQCRECGGWIKWIDCPTGGWWAHDKHPSNNHDAEPCNL